MNFCIACNLGIKESLGKWLDVSKAYDQVEWSFLQGMIMENGFDSRRVSQIK